MDELITEKLFLLEFLIDKVDLHSKQPNVNTCVSIQFLDNPPINICEEDFSPKRRYSQQSASNITTGKSCLFSLTPNQAKDAKSNFDIRVTVFQKSDEESQLNELGNVSISVVDLFTQLISLISSHEDDSSPADRTMKDVYQISDVEGKNVGSVGMYIRMSCFGKLIVTQFQMNMQDKSIVFKDKEGHSLYRYKKAGVVCDGECNDNNLLNSLSPNENSFPCSTCVPQEQLSPCNVCSQQNPAYSGTCSSTQYSTQHPQKSALDVRSSFQEIGASMGGNTVTIRVHKDKKLKQLDSAEDDIECSCTCTQNCSKQANAGGASEPFSFTLGGCGMAESSNVTVVPPTYNAPDGSKITELSDPNRNVFILRVSKKGVSSNEKNNLELELCTPKGPDRRPPPKLETKDTEWNQEDALAAGLKNLSGGAIVKTNKR